MRHLPDALHPWLIRFMETVPVTPSDGTQSRNLLRGANKGDLQNVQNLNRQFAASIQRNRLGPATLYRFNAQPDSRPTHLIQVVFDNEEQLRAVPADAYIQAEAKRQDRGLLPLKTQSILRFRIIDYPTELAAEGRVTFLVRQASVRDG